MWGLDIKILLNMIKQNRFKVLIMSNKPVPNGTDVAMLCACGDEVLSDVGGSFELSYRFIPATSEAPQPQWILSETKIYDGHAGDGADTLRSVFACEGGRYDRHERTSLGFSKVTASQMNGDGTVYRTVVSEYLNDNFYKKGLLVRQTTVDAAGNIWVQTENSYTFKNSGTMADVDEAGLASISDLAVKSIFPALTRTETRYFEGEPTARQTLSENFVYGNYGNATGYSSTGTGVDEISSTIAYHELTDKYIVSVPSGITVSGGGNVLRQRSTGVDGSGRVTQITQATGGEAAVYDFEYDRYGNLQKTTRPASYKGERMWFEYAYDADVQSYVTQVRDAFGYASSTEYDYRFGVPTRTVDLNGQETTYTYDALGRPVTVQAPTEKAAGVPFTIAFEYHPEAAVPWALTRHYDPQHPDNWMETALFIDGLGREFQTKKDGAMFAGKGQNDTERMIVSGRVTYDAMGRAVQSRYPVTEPKGNTGTFNTAADGIAPARVSYDVMDRAVETTLPDGAKTLMAYGFGEDRDGILRLRTTATDANGKLTEIFTDVRGRQTAVKAPNDTWTSFAYSPLGELLQSADPEGNATTHEYDLLGRRLSRHHPDAGLTEWTYDAAGNLLTQTTPNLRAKNAAITYEYAYNRLNAVKYPDYPNGNLRYEYG